MEFFQNNSGQDGRGVHASFDPCLTVAKDAAQVSNNGRGGAPPDCEERFWATEERR
jgi:hypothetical protein